MKRVILPLLILVSTTLSAQRVRREYTPSPVVGTAWNAPNNINPFIPGYFADPTIRKFGDTYYLYATTDGTGNGYGPAQVWVSKDFVNWRNFVMNWPTAASVIIWRWSTAPNTAPRIIPIRASRIKSVILAFFKATII